MRHSRKHAINPEVAPLYEIGLSLREISDRLRIPKTAVRDALIVNGVSLRSHSPVTADLSNRARKIRIGIPPFGFSWLRGRLVVDPNEIEVVQLVIELWRSGQTYAAITRRMNELGKVNRAGGKWDHSLVRSIVRRHKNNPEQIEEIPYWNG